MSARTRWLAVALVCAVLVAGVAVYLVSAALQQPSARGAASGEIVSVSALDGPRIVFRTTAEGAGYGHVASVPLDDPSGERVVTDLVCDRVDSDGRTFSCLRSERGVLTTYTAREYDADGALVQERPLPGIPSRTRLSSDGAFVATTSFVTGHSYATIGFSTATEIAETGGASLGNLETFSLELDGAPVTAPDRNFWGVTFTGDGRTFYATAATGGRTWIVRGDLGERTLTGVRQGGECPSLSPDGTRLAYKKNLSTGLTAQWAIAVLDLEREVETVLPETRSVDDQIEWLDDDTVLYGLPREGVAGDTDVWALDVSGGEPELFIEHAWSPSVVR